jgi:putative hydrolase of the HAD superfamily
VEVDVLVEIPFKLGAAHAGFVLMQIDERQHLIFDADDTLWENNIYFEQAFAEFCAYLNHSTLTPDEIRGVLDEIEIENNRIHGYGALNFGRNLSQCFLHLAERAVEEHDLKRVTAFAHEILLREVELMEGVAETLPLLAERHELTLFTKGHPDEQNRKIDLSGLRPLFTHCAVVKEKNPEAYAELARTRNFDLERTWMIGNSPRSDLAGPPFQTDDPEPIEFRHYEFYTFASSDGTPVETDTSGPALEFNWGALPNVHLHIILPLAAILPSNNPALAPAGTGPRALSV